MFRRVSGQEEAAHAGRQGSDALDLTRWSTGRSGAGSPEAKAALEEIVRLLS